MKNTTKIFGVALFISGILLMFLDIYFLNNPEYRSMIKAWHIISLIVGGIILYIFDLITLKKILLETWQYLLKKFLK